MRPAGRRSSGSHLHKCGWNTGGVWGCLFFVVLSAPLCKNTCGYTEGRRGAQHCRQPEFAPLCVWGLGLLPGCTTAIDSALSARRRTA